MPQIVFYLVSFNLVFFFELFEPSFADLADHWNVFFHKFVSKSLRENLLFRFPKFSFCKGKPLSKGLFMIENHIHIFRIVPYVTGREVRLYEIGIHKKYMDLIQNIAYADVK